MKKLFNILLIILTSLNLFACNNKDNMNYDDQISNLPLGMYASVVSYKDGILTLEIDNQSGYQMDFDKLGQLQFDNNGTWINVDMIEGAIIEDTIYTLKDLEKVEVKYDLNNLYGKLDAGTYRLLWEDMEVSFNIN